MKRKNGKLSALEIASKLKSGTTFTVIGNRERIRVLQAAKRMEKDFTSRVIGNFPNESYIIYPTPTIK